jgi:3-deoxy-manno-octulosonate cytidylyltransferase (CMP-KDO synthetase)
LEISSVNPIVLIPADIAGRPMIVHVLEAAAAAGVGRVAVAAGDAEIVEAVRAAGGEAVLTDPDLPSGSDRIRAALHALDPEGRCDTVINLQGDMPFVQGEVLQACARLLAGEPGCDIATVVAPEHAPADRSNPDVVKAVLALPEGGREGRALYFTRSTLYGEGPVWRHIGIYGYRREALERFTEAPPSP